MIRPLRALLISGVRFHLRRPVQFALAMCGVALGVAVVVAMFLAIDSAKRGFDHANQAVFGNVTHVIKSGPEGIDERLYVHLSVQWPMLVAAPIVHSVVSIGPPGSGQRVQVMGIDPLVDSEFRDQSPSAFGESAVAGRLLSEPATVALSERAARRHGVAVGERLEIRVAGKAVDLLVVAVLGDLNELQSAALDQVLIVDIATAQEVLGMVGRLSRIDLKLPASSDTGVERAQLLEQLRAVLPAGARLQRGDADATVREQMTRAFYLNLRMLSVLALVVGLFIIYNAMSFSVVQRRSVFGTLRALGVTGRELLVAVLAEAFVLGALATVLGIPIGIALAEVLLSLVTRTVDDLYFLSAVRDLHVSAAALAPALALGLCGSLFAALMPALEATAIPPRAAMNASYLERRMRRAVPVMAGTGVCALLFCALLLAADGRGLASAFGALFALVLAAVALTPAMTMGLAKAMQGLLPAGGSSVVLMGVRGINAGLSRSSVAVAALMVALATTVGVAVMVNSFRLSLHDWLQTTLQSDIYVGVAGEGTTASIDPQLIERIKGLPQVETMTMSRDVTVNTDHGEIALKAMSETRDGYRGLSVVRGDEAGAWAGLRRDDAVLISESLAWRIDVGVGSMLAMQTPQGVHTVRVAAVVRDYTSDQGLMIVGLGAYRRLFSDHGVSALGIGVEPGAAPSDVVTAIERLIGRDLQLRVSEQQSIREASIVIFDRTFAITKVLQWLATIVACVGVLSALMSLALERSHEVAVLRAQGLTRGEVLTLMQVQSVAMGAIAGVLSLPLGALMALILTHVINRRAFGWGMEFHLSGDVLMHTMVVAVVSAVLAGMYPAWRISRVSPALALRWG